MDVTEYETVLFPSSFTVIDKDGITSGPVWTATKISKYIM